MVAYKKLYYSHCDEQQYNPWKLPAITLNHHSFHRNTVCQSIIFHDEKDLYLVRHMWEKHKKDENKVTDAHTALLWDYPGLQGVKENLSY